MKAYLQADFGLAFDLVAYQMACAIFGGEAGAGAGALAMAIEATPDVPGGEAAAGDDEAPAGSSPGARMLKAEAGSLELDWLRETDRAGRFRAFRKLPPKGRRDLFAAAAARALEPQLAFDPARRPETEIAAEALDIPFHRLYRPDLERFWRRMGRREMLAVAADTLGEKWEEAHASDRKDALAEAMAAAFGPTPPAESLGVSAEARDRALAWAPPGFEPAGSAAGPPPAGDGAGTPPATDAADTVPDWMRR